MENHLKLSIALRNAFEREHSLEERWSVIERAERILVRRAKRAMIIRGENNPAKMAMLHKNEPAYKAMRSTATRMQNNLTNPRLVALVFG